MAKSLILAGNLTNSTTNAFLDATTTYMPIAGRWTRDATGFSGAKVRIPVAGTLRNFRVYSPTNTVSSTTALTLYKDSASTSITVSFTSDQTGEKEDTTNSVSVTANEEFAVYGSPTAEAGSNYLQVTTASLEFEPTSSGNTYTVLGTGAGTGNLTTASVTRYVPWRDGYSATLTGSTDADIAIYGGGDIVHWQSYATAVRATATSRKLVINGTASTTFTNSHTAANTHVYSTGTQTISDGDLLGQSTVTGTGTDTFTGGVSSAWIVNTSGKWTTVAGDSATIALAAATTYYLGLGVNFGGIGNTTEADVKQRFRFATTAEYLRTKLNNNLISSGSTTFVLRVNGADQTDLTTSYTTGQTGIKTDTGSVAIASGDLVNVKVTVGTGGTSSTRDMAVGFNNGTGGVTGTIAATEAQDTASISGVAYSVLTGTLVISEAQDTASIAGIAYTAITGTLAATEAQDTVDIAGTVSSGAVITGTMAVTDTPDSASMSGVAYTVITGSLAATENQDTAALTGNLIRHLTGTLAATEAQDTADIAGTVSNGAITITGTLDATEAQDTTNIQGLAFTVITGTLAATETQDSCSIIATLIHNLTGTLNATEEQDTCSILGYINGMPAVSWIDGVGYGTVSGSGVVDVAHTDAGTEVSTVSQNKMDSTVRRWKV
jgi:hypothetical protein